MKPHDIYWRGEPIGMLRRPELIEAAEVAISELHLEGTPVGADLPTRTKKYLEEIIGMAANSAPRFRKRDEVDLA